MANSKNFKRRVRARMERTGESYMVAMHALRDGKPEPSMTDAEVVAEYGEHLGIPLRADREGRPCDCAPTCDVHLVSEEG